MKKIFLLLFLATLVYSQTNIYNPNNPQAKKSSLEDFGKMYTFDDIPFEKWDSLYGFNPSEEWIDSVKKSALQFSSYCSASFVSPQGLIMTNHHCGRNVMLRVEKEGEDLLKNGFYAQTLEEERKIPNLYVDQLIFIEDVTSEILSAIKDGKTDKEKIENREKAIREIEKRYREDTGLVCSVVTLYNGGKYSVHGYKRYTDIRLVMAPEFQIASTGWDWDNFTYPRYELDFMFFRAYEDDKPVNTNYYFKWSKNGAKENEPLFVIGRPGNTDRLLSYAELEYLRDYRNPYTLKFLNGLYEAYFTLFQKHPERESELLNAVMGIGNGRKVYAGLVMGLNDKTLMARKKDFEEKLIKKINADENLKNAYGHIWEGLDRVIAEIKTYSPKLATYRISNYGAPLYLKAAKKIVDIADEMKSGKDFTKEELEEKLSKIYSDKIDYELENLLLKSFVDYIRFASNGKDPFINKHFGSDEVFNLIENSELHSIESAIELLSSGAESVLQSSNPIIKFVLESKKVNKEISPKYKEAENTLKVLNQELGEAIFAVYGDMISPDATSTLRITDGTLKIYEYNGTLAPSHTTYFGMYDRYYSFGKKTYPWGLPERWSKIPEGLDLNTPVDIATTNDIVGGNSGSGMINKNREIVGLVFDGNLESLAGTYLYLPEKNRTVAVDSRGLLEALKKVYKADRLVKELEATSK